MGDIRYFFLLKDYFGVKIEKRLLKSKLDANVQVIAGTLWYVDSNYVKDAKERRALSQEYPDICLIFGNENEPGLFKQITQGQHNALLAVETCKQRFTIVQTDEFKNLNRFVVNELVDALLSPQRTEYGCGFIRYVGEPSTGVGTWFGVELIGKWRGKGNCNGTFKKKYSCFLCEENCGVFVNIGQIRIHRGDVSEEHTVATVTMGERVVWISDTGPEFGTVRWIGCLPGANDNELTVGVEFDNPVGTGTGRYQDQQLFHTRMNHASLVPIMGLMKEADFLNTQSPFFVSSEPVTTGKAFVSRQQHIEQQTQSAGRTGKRVPSPLRAPSYEAGTYPGSSGRVSQASREGRPDAKSIYDTYRRTEDVKRNQSSDNISASLDRSDGTNSQWQFRDTALGKGVAADLSSPMHSPMDVHDVRSLQANVTSAAAMRPPLQSDSTGGGMLPQHLRTVNKASPVKTVDSFGLSHQADVHSAPAEQTSATRTSIMPTAIDPVAFKLDLELGAMVEVVGGTPNCRYGELKWLGRLRPDMNKIYAGIQMEEESEACTDGSFQGVPIFACPMRRAFFVNVSRVRRDPRFQEVLQTEALQRHDSQRFGKIGSPDIEDIVEPPMTVDLVHNYSHYVGLERGIQGHHNSCYLDATLFAMFAFSTAMDAMLFRQKLPSDLDEFEDVQKILRDGIVNPLRKNFYVRADKLMKLRQMLAKLTHGGQGLLGEEKDPEEFLKILLQDVFQCEPLLKLSSSQSTYLLPLIMEKDASLKIPTTQQLLDRSCHQEHVKLLERPSCMMLQMPRFGKDYKLFEKIIPSLKLDIGGILNDAPRICEMCGQKTACLECSECRDDLLVPNHSFYCKECCITYHQHPKRTNHQPKSIHVNPVFEDSLTRYIASGQSSQPLDEEIMELYGVICIATSHYVSFVKCGKGDKAPWLFFDSMADRVGGQEGYNIPKVVECSDMHLWLDPQRVHTASDRDIPPLVNRLLCDSYICLYQSPLLTMYK